MSESDQLVVPSPAKDDPNSVELARIWVANKGQHVSLRMGVWSDPAAWGILLADLARHVANAYHEDAGLDRRDTLRRIEKMFKKELASPTDKASGGILR